MRLATPHRTAAFRDPLYKIRFHLYHAPEARLVAACKRDGQDIIAHAGAARCINYVAPGYGQLVVHLWFDPSHRLSSPFGASCVAHECVHAAHAVFARIGAKASFAWEDDEPYAYYVEWLVCEVMRRLRA